MSWKIIDEEILSENPWTSFRRRGFEMPNGKRGNYFFAKTRNGCSKILPRLPDGKFVLIREYRFLDEVMSVEFPGGGIDIDQTAEQAARAELQQEVGYEAGKLELIGRSSPSMGVLIDPTYYYLADDLRFVGIEQEHTEEIEVITASESEIDQMVRDGTIIDGQSLSGWAIYKAHGNV